MATVRPFTIHVADDVIDDLHRRLDATRWPPAFGAPGWDAGCNRDTVIELCRAWRHDFDWRAVEARLNRVAHGMFDLDGRIIHFAHLPGPSEDALPLVLSHGWPSSFTEFLGLAERLADPASFGADARDGFSVVVPSLPGYGWSSPPSGTPHGPVEIARDWLELMSALGHDRFAAHGSDWGAAVTVALGGLAPERVVGIHVTTPPLPARLDHPSPSVREWLEVVGAYRAQESGYAALQSTRPRTPAFALTDSPAGLLAWIVEKWWRWSDDEDEHGVRDLLRAFTIDEVLANVMVYWSTSSIGSSMQLYHDAVRATPIASLLPLHGVPLGVVACHEVITPPREVVDAHYDLRRWVEIPRGGHFPALENPDALADEIRAFFHADGEGDRWTD